MEERQGYIRSWKHWAPFCQGKGASAWMTGKEEGRGEASMQFILSEHDVLGLNASIVRSKISGIRYPHLISGGGGFSKVGARWGFSLKRLTRKNKVVNRRPSARYGVVRIRPDSTRFTHTNRGLEFNRSWTAALIGFMFLLRAIELEALDVRDTTFGKRRPRVGKDFYHEIEKWPRRGGGVPQIKCNECNIAPCVWNGEMGGATRPRIQGRPGVW